MSDNWIRKALVFVVIGLFIGAGVPPNILTTTVKADLTTDLIAWWSFNDGTADDNWGTYNGALYGDPTYHSTGGPDGSGCFGFDGDGDFITTPLNQLGTQTVSFWFKLDNGGSLISTHVKNDNNGNFVIMGSGSDCGLRVRAIDGWTDNLKAGSQNEYNDGDWHHCAFTHDGGYYKLFVDGGPVPDDTYSGSALTDNRPYVMGRLEPSSAYPYWLDGALDDVRIYNRVLDDSEIEQLFECGENHSPNLPSNPSPSDNAVDVSTDIELSWICDDPDPGDTITYDVHFGIDPTPDSNDIVSIGQIDTTYDPGILEIDTHYYWRIFARDNHDHVTWGPTWDFTTGLSDGNQPVVTINSPSSGSFVHGKVDITGTASDPNGDDIKKIFISTYDSWGNSWTFKIPGSTIWRYEWDTCNFQTGSYEIAVVANDGVYNSHEVRIQVNIENYQPATPLKPSGPHDDLHTNLGGYTYSTSTIDPDGDDLFYSFDWGKGEGSSGWIGPYRSGETVNVEHKWTCVGDYNIRVQARDIYRKSSEFSEGLTVHVTEGNMRPQVKLIESPEYLDIGEEGTFTFRAWDPDNYAISILVDWGDGTDDYGRRERSPHDYIINHKWDEGGVYTIKVNVWSGFDWNTAYYPQPVGPYDNQPPTCHIEGISASITELDEPITFTADAVDPDGWIKEYRWSSNRDGEFKVIENDEVTYSGLSAGTHKISLIVKDNYGDDSDRSEEVVLRIIDGRVFRPPFETGINSHFENEGYSGDSEDIYTFTQRNARGDLYALSDADVPGQLECNTCSAYAGHYGIFKVDNPRTDVDVEAKVLTKGGTFGGAFASASTSLNLKHVEEWMDHDWHMPFSFAEKSLDNCVDELDLLLVYLSFPFIPNVIKDIATLYQFYSTYADFEEYKNQDWDEEIISGTCFIRYSNRRHAIGVNVYTDAGACGIGRYLSCRNGIVDYIIVKGAESGPGSQLSVTSMCPVDITIIDPLGRRINKTNSGIPDAIYTEGDSNFDGDLDDHISIPSTIKGKYIIYVEPEPGADSMEKYSLECEYVGEINLLADHIFISEIPDEPYGFDVNSPLKPNIPAPLDSQVGITSFEYSFSTSSVHPDGKRVYYLWDWGDGNDDWFGPFDSGEICTASHIWRNPGFYQVKVKAKLGLESEWSEPLTLVMMDGIPPVTKINVGHPKQRPNDEWVTSYTKFNLTATDDSSGVDKIYYRIWYDGLWSELIEYTTSFTLTGEGKHHIEYYSVDNAGNVEEVHNQTHYVDDSAPEINLYEPITLWPPNHKYHTITLSDFVLDVCDNYDSNVDIEDVVITNVSSDEPENGNGDGNTCDDIVILDNQTVKLRKERKGNGNGRVYTINFMVSDWLGNIATDCFKIMVPHSQGSTAVDDGPDAGYTVYYP